MYNFLKYLSDIRICLKTYYPVANPISKSDSSGVRSSDVVETVTSETETWLKFRDDTETETLS